MNNKFSDLWIINLCLLSSITFGFHQCSSGDNLQVNKAVSEPMQMTTSESVDRVVELIESCPAWNLLYENDVNDRQIVITRLQEIAKFDVSVVRLAVEKYYKRKEADNSFDITSKSRLYVLNRYIFNAPSKTNFEGTAFGGWAGVPYDETENTINWMWPLSMDDNGNLQLTGRFRGYYGPPYRVIEEFDYFNKRFGRRQVKVNSDKD